ncbi:MAG: hypothetical protein Q9212_002732 [Teloschistes hypoglaucus]
MNSNPVITAAELLLQAREMKAMDRPSDRDYRSVLHYLEADGGQLYEAEMDYIYEKEDLVTLRPSPGCDHGGLDVLVERFLLYFRCKPLTESRAKTSSKTLHYYDRQRISSFTSLLTALAILLVHICSLYKLSIAVSIITSSEAIGPMVLLTLLFSVELLAFAVVAASAA